jgi:hypothetical protein
MIDFSTAKAIKIPEGAVYKITRNGETLWESSYINMVARSTESDGKTIYNGGLGYKNGYRVRSGGAEASAGSVSCTGFIPVNGLSVIRVAGTTRTFVDGGTGSAINVADASFNNLGQVVGNSYGYGIFESAYKSYNSSTVIQKDGYWQWTVPPAASGVAYIRVTGTTGGDGSKLIVTVDQEIS